MRIIAVRNVDGFVTKTRRDHSKRDQGTVRAILADVQKNGDAAVKKYEKKFGAGARSLRVSETEIKRAYRAVSKSETAAIRGVKRRLENSERILKSKLQDFTVRDGATSISRSFFPIQSVGCYVPGGLARYPSSAIMSIVPARIAGVGRIVAVTPPDGAGRIDPMTLVAADMCGATEVYKAGGAQAIGALSYGTASIRPVDKIVGPGGAFVTIAKSQVGSHQAIDMTAGPTELGIIADASSDAQLVAADLISQAEHSRDTFCHVITDSPKKASEIDAILDKRAASAQRGGIIRASLQKNGFIAVCRTKKDMIDLANRLAAEHLEIMTKNPGALGSKINAAGLVLLGPNTPSAASDYLLGSNHILPTGGAGRTRGSLSVLDFLKLGTQVRTSADELARIAPHMKTLTSSEGLPNHYAALEERLQ